MSVGICVTLLLFLVLPVTTALRCFVGKTTEYQCEGVGCARIIRKYPYSSYFSTHHDELNVAMTCVMAETRHDGPEPEGCHMNAVTLEERCVCYDHDFCNSVPGLQIGIKILLACHVFQLNRVFL